MAVLQGEFCAVNIEVAFRAKPNVEVAILQRAGIARVYCSSTCRLATLFSDWTEAGEKGLVTLIGFTNNKFTIESTHA